MGKVKELIILLAEELEDLLWHTGNFEDAERNLKHQLSSDEWEFYLENKDYIIDTLELSPLQPEERKKLDHNSYKNLDESIKRWSIKRVIDEKLKPIADSLGLELDKGKTEKKTVMTATKVINQHYNIGNAHIVIQDVKVPGMGADNVKVYVLDPGDEDKGRKFIGMNLYEGLEDAIKEAVDIPADGNLRTPRYTEYNKSKLLKLIKDLRIGAADENKETIFDIVDGVFSEEEGLEEFIRKELEINDPIGWMVNQII